MNNTTFSIFKQFSYYMLFLFLFHSGLSGCSDQQKQAGQQKQDSTIAQTQKESDALYRARENFKWGFVDANGLWVINPQFDSVSGFSDGIARAQIAAKGEEYEDPTHYSVLKQIDFKGGKWGFIDKKGKWFVEPRFDDVELFDEDGIARAKENMKWGFIDKSGKWVIEPKFDEVWTFKEGLVCAKEGVNWGFIDKTGNWVINPQFETAYSFEEGLAAVKTWSSFNDNETYPSPGKYGFIDKSGNWVIKPQFHRAHSFQEGLAAVGMAKMFRVNDLYPLDTKYGYIDKNGSWIVEPQFDYAESFKEGLAAVNVSATRRFGSAMIEGKWGFIYKDGKWAVNPQFDTADSFEEELAAVSTGGKIKKIDNKEFIIEKKYGFIDKSGIWVVKPQFDTAHSFKEGVAAVKNEQKWGFINKTGQFIIKPVFVNFLRFNKGCIGRRTDGKNIVCNKTGKVIWVEESKSGLIKKIVDEDEPDKSADQNIYGSGFYINSDGHVITNYHVVENGKEIKISGVKAEIVAYDATNDLALLKIENKPSSHAVFSSKGKVELGEDILAYGFPLTGVLSSGGNLTVGTVSALSGIANNINHLQITAPLQSGNSGGPLINRKGHIVGVLVAKLNAAFTAQLTGNLPENVNFAINEATVRAFLDLHKVSYSESGWVSLNKSNEEIASEAQKYTVKVESFK